MSAVQRRLQRLIREDEERGVGSIQDSAFFEQNPQRNFRMRLATQVRSRSRNSSATMGCRLQCRRMPCGG